MPRGAAERVTPVAAFAGPAPTAPAQASPPATASAALPTLAQSACFLPRRDDLRVVNATRLSVASAKNRYRVIEQIACMSGMPGNPPDNYLRAALRHGTGVSPLM